MIDNVGDPVSVNDRSACGLTQPTLGGSPLATIDDVRAAGFTSEALAYPRDEAALRLLCAFVGVDWQKAPPGWWFHPNATTKAAWERVAVEARRIFANG